MKYDIRRPRKPSRNNELWSRWFAWRPVTMRYERQVVWLEMCWRRKPNAYGFDIWEYTQHPAVLPIGM